MVAHRSLSTAAKFYSSGSLACPSPDEVPGVVFDVVVSAGGQDERHR